MPSDVTTLDPAILDEILGALVVVTPEGEIVSWNRGAEVLFGYTADEAVRRSIFDLIVPPERADETRKQFEKTLAIGASAYESERRRKDGSSLPVAVSLRPTKGADGRTLIVKNDRDITDLAYLRQSQRLATKFGGLLEASPDAMVIMNKEGRLVLVNSQAENLFGYPRAELLGAMVEVLVPERYRAAHPAHRRGYFHDPKPRPMGRGLDLSGRRKDGSEFPAEISLSPMETDEGTAALALTQARKFDAIVLDLLLPDVGGEDVLRAIRADGPNRQTPVIVASVLADKGLSAAYQVIEVLTKPVIAADLLGRLAREGIVPPTAGGKEG
jgi:protein-histidine pros-kinase